MKAFKNASVYVEGEGLVKTSLSFDKAVTDIGNGADGEIIELPEGAMVLPGFIDIHIHGAGGYDTMDASEEALSNIAKTVAKEGTTAFLATTMTQSRENILAALEAVRSYRENRSAEGAELIGVHLEGPFICEKFCGAQPKEYIEKPTAERFDEYMAASGGGIKVLTFAPEVEGAPDFVKHICSCGVVASVGHSAAREADVRAVIEAGAKSVTHTYNAQSGVHHRDIGVAGSALLYDDLACELIADGIHISAPAMKLLARNKPWDKLLLVTDAMRAKGCPDGESELGGQKVIVKRGEARLVDGTLAGSVLKMNVALKNLVELVGVPLERAIDCVSKNPARLLGIENERGSIAVGKKADFCVLDNNFNVLLTIREGEIIYKE